MKETKMMIVFIVCLIAAFGLGAAAGYSLNTSHANENTPVNGSPVNPALRTFGMADNNTTVSLKTGDEFIVQLAENPTTGYVWTPTSTQGLDVLSSKYTVNNSSLIGGGGIREWHIQVNRFAAMEGAQRFVAACERPWENTTEPIAAFSLNINVAE